MVHARCGLIMTMVIASVVLGGCQTTRLDKLRAKSDKVESNLRKERDRVLRTDVSAERQPRLTHLSNLNGTLSMTNIALSAVPLLVPNEQRDMAYDVLDEAYDTIDWNIPLGPGDVKRPMPVQLQGSSLRLH